MKCVILFILCLIAIQVNGEPPNYRFNKYEAPSSRQVKSPATDVEPILPQAEAPYPPSGWKPAGQRLELPPRASATPATEYLPADSYGPPTTSANEDSSTTDSTTDESSEEVTSSPTSSNLVESVPITDQKINEQGAYYILLPDSRLQKILYSVSSDPEKQQFSSRLQSVSSQALSSPLIFYTPQFVQVA